MRAALLIAAALLGATAGAAERYVVARVVNDDLQPVFVITDDEAFMQVPQRARVGETCDCAYSLVPHGDLNYCSWGPKPRPNTHDRPLAAACVKL